MAIWLQRPVAYVWRETGSSALPGETLGHARIPTHGRVDAARLPIALAGYWVEGEDGWPPSYAAARTEPLEAIDTIIRVLDLDADQYDALVALTAEILADPDFRRLVDTLARALRCCPRLDGRAVRELTAAASIPYPEPEGEPACNT